ncbi:MAG TPA: DUF1330 domain-containing protein [Dehalococcoidia bacterium]
MTAYVVAEVNVHDLEKYMTYASKVGATVGNFGGKISAANEADVREGSLPFTRTIIGEFPDAAAASAWYESEEYREILPLRLEATSGTLLFVEGIAMPPTPETRQD